MSHAAAWPVLALAVTGGAGTLFMLAMARRAGHRRQAHLWLLALGQGLLGAAAALTLRGRSDAAESLLWAVVPVLLGAVVALVLGAVRTWRRQGA